MIKYRPRVLGRMPLHLIANIPFVSKLARSRGMTKMATLEDAVSIAAQAHCGQKDQRPMLRK
ncbi:MAG TPA: hypothetical protein DCK99_10385 [Blastocatellia bacterium]|nr:hypothetical protein [Blastocatellia bacterium]